MRTRFMVSGFILAMILSATPARAASIGLGVVTVTTDGTLVPVRVFGVSDLLGEGIEIVGFDFQALLGDAVLLNVLQGDFFKGGDFLGFDVDSSTRLLTVLSTLIGEVSGPLDDGVLAVLVFAGGAIGSPEVVILGGNIGRFIGLADPQFDSVPLTIDVPPQPVPEPSTLGLLGVGLAALARRLRRKRQPHSSQAELAAP
jgi:hypothetical protein